MPAKAITVEMLIRELSQFNKDLPVYIQIGDGEPLDIADVAISFEKSDGSDGKITIEHWTTAEDENEPGVII